MDTKSEAEGGTKERSRARGDDDSTEGGNPNSYSPDFSKMLGLDSGEDPESEDSGSKETTPFLQSPEVLWQEPQAEKVLTYMGNGSSIDSLAVCLEVAN